jgi:KaiC/GvpD/RAD55 family RecA-like ATPase
MNKKTLTELIPIGIPVIDEYIVGLPSNAVILIIGDPGSGFITFLHQLLVFC